MPLHTVSSSYKADAAVVPIGGTTYSVPGECNELLVVPAGATDLEFDFEFLFGKVVCYCIALGTQTAAQAALGTFSEALTGSVDLKWNSTGTPVPDMTLDAKKPHVFADCLPGTVNEFTANITKVYASNAGAAPLVVSVKVGLNT